MTQQEFKEAATALQVRHSVLTRLAEAAITSGVKTGQEAVRIAEDTFSALKAIWDAEAADLLSHQPPAETPAEQS